VARLEFDRLEVRREQFEIRAAELLEKIVLGPTGHMTCSGRESAPARTLRFRDGTDGSKVYTGVFPPLKSWPLVCGIPEVAGVASRGRTRGIIFTRSVQECTQQARGSA
jgi:hypothetical protein